MSVNGGSTATSTSSSSFGCSEKASFCTSAMASRWLRFIFQLPAIRGRRSSVLGGMRSVLQNVQAGQGLALEVLQARAAAGRDVTKGRVVEAERADGSGRV